MTVNELIKNWIVVFDKLKTIKEDKGIDTVQQLMSKIAGSEILAKVTFTLTKALIFNI